MVQRLLASADVVLHNFRVGVAERRLASVPEMASLPPGYAPLRAGPGPRLLLPGVGEHTVEILGELGFTPAEIDALLAAKVARQLGNGA